MKKVLVAAQSRYLAGIDRQYTTATISDMLFENRAMPITVHFSTHITSVREGYKQAKRYVLDLKPHGILLQGGEDIPISFYTAAHEHDSATMRDYFELGLIQVALENNIPLFGICRGMQLINVAMGGTLIAHLEESDYSPHILLKDPTLGMVMENSQMHVHAVNLISGGMLEKWYGDSCVQVTSFHHQAVKDLASELTLEGLAEDGVIEAFSHKDKRIIGLQWHPEVPKDSTLDTKALHGWVDWL